MYLEIPQVSKRPHGQLNDRKALQKNREIYHRQLQDKAIVFVKELYNSMLILLF